MSDCDGNPLVSELDSLLAHIRRCSINELDLDQKFYQTAQQGAALRQQLANLLREKATLEGALAASSRQRAAATNKLNAAMAVVQRERRHRERAAVERDRARAHFEQLCAQLAEPRAKELQSRLAAQMETAACSTTDLDVTVDSTFLSASLAPSSGVESDWSAPKARSRICGFTPNRASSLRHSAELPNGTFSLASADCSVSSIGSTLISEDSRKSAVFYAAIVERLKSRPHAFGRKTFVLGEQCSACASKVACGHRALLCADCRSVAHEKCGHKVPRPCIPAAQLAPPSKWRRSVHDYAPRSAPFVPALVVHCVLRVEQGGLTQAGLYKVSTFDRTVEELKRSYGKNRGIPNLAPVDVLAVCQFLKEWLAELRPALIAGQLFDEWLRTFEPLAVAKIAFEVVVDAVDQLDQTSRDTLVFLLLHLQNVAAAEAVNMSAKRLSKVFTPLLVDGYEKGVFQEEKRKCQLLQKFIELPADYWKIIFVKDL